MHLLRPKPPLSNNQPFSGPRIFAFFIYGPEVFSYHDYYFWIPIISPFFGAVLGSWLYSFLVGFQIQEPETKLVLGKNGELEPLH